LFEEVFVEGVHGGVSVCLIYKVNRGGVEKRLFGIL
jgi:hypothetical protein